MSTYPAYQRFFAELKRRQVFRVVAVYGVVGFVGFVNTARARRAGRSLG